MNNIKKAIKKCFGALPNGSDGVLLVRVDDYNALIDEINRLGDHEHIATIFFNMDVDERDAFYKHLGKLQVETK